MRILTLVTNAQMSRSQGREMVPAARRRRRRSGRRARLAAPPVPAAGARFRLITSAFVLIAIAVTGAVMLASATAAGRAIIAAVQRFLLFYGGVFALITLTAAVAAGLIATDRIIMSPGNRIAAQAVHRAISLAAVGFLVIHVTLEILAARSHPVDSVVPFLARHRTLYAGLGTVSADLILLITATGIIRKRFAALARPWAWRATHALAYAAWPLAILHGLLAGRTAKPYVDWSYGACLAAVGLALLIRSVATIRRKEVMAAPAGGPGGWSTMPPPGLAGSPPALLALSGPAGVPAASAGAPPAPAAPFRGAAFPPRVQAALPPGPEGLARADHSGPLPPLPAGTGPPSWPAAAGPGYRRAEPGPQARPAGSGPPAPPAGEDRDGPGGLPRRTPGASRHHRRPTR
jgi:hypothetical protein